MVTLHAICERQYVTSDGSSVAVGLKVMCFVALRLEDEPLFEMSVELEGTQRLHGFAQPGVK